MYTLLLISHFTSIDKSAISFYNLLSLDQVFSKKQFLLDIAFEINCFMENWEKIKKPFQQNTEKFSSNSGSEIEKCGVFWQLFYKQICCLNKYKKILHTILRFMDLIISKSVIFDSFFIVVSTPEVPED